LLSGSPGQAYRRRMAQAQCPIQPGQPCNLCHPEAHEGPQDCPLIWLVMDDPDLRALWQEKRAAARASA